MAGAKALNRAQYKYFDRGYSQELYSSDFETEEILKELPSFRCFQLLYVVITLDSSTTSDLSVKNYHFFSKRKFCIFSRKSTFVLLKNDNSNHNDFNHFRMVAHSAVLVYKGPSTYKQTNLIIPGKRKGMDHRTSSPVITCLGLNSKTMHIVSRDAIGQCFIPQTHNEGAVCKHHNKDVCSGASSSSGLSSVTISHRI